MYQFLYWHFLGWPNQITQKKNNTRTLINILEEDLFGYKTEISFYWQGFTINTTIITNTVLLVSKFYYLLPKRKNKLLILIYNPTRTRLLQEVSVLGAWQLSYSYRDLEV